MTVHDPIPPMTDDGEFRYWSDRSEQETAQAINAQCRKARAAHLGLAVLCVRQALTYAPSTDAVHRSEPSETS